MFELNFKKSICSLFFAAATLSSANAQITVHTIGDSTMAEQSETGEIRGWGQMFQQFFDTDQVIVNNRGKSGASSKSFYLESPYWATVKNQIKAGDYVIIQFAHNDEKNNGMDGDELKALYTNAGKSSEAAAVDYRGTTASGTYKEYLRKYVNEARELGATPILATGICRNYWTGSVIRLNGQHNLGDSFDMWDEATNSVVKGSVPNTDLSYCYPHSTKEIATELSVPVIDLTNITKSLYESYGQSNCSNLIFTSNDNTHPSALGATLIARLCAQEMKNQNILATAIQADADLLINPTALDFETAYAGQVVTKTITVSAFDLSDKNGKVNVSATNGVELSLARDGQYTPAIEIAYDDNNLSCATVYVQYKFAAVGVLNSEITVAAGGKSKSISVTANCVEVASGTEVSLTWPLNKNDECELKGPATAIAQSWSEMVVQRYATPNANTIWPSDAPYQNGEITQRNLIDNGAGEWPGSEIDEVSTRYIQFGVSANEGSVLNIDSIGMYVSGAGGNGMRCRIYYMVGNGTGIVMAAADGTNLSATMVANTMYEVNARPVVALQPGETLYVRVYPWYTSKSTGKTICLSHVTIHGYASSIGGTSIQDITNNLEVIKEEFISPAGIVVLQPQKGINLVRKTLSDGSVVTEKIIK